MGNFPEAQDIYLHKRNARAPFFHEFIAKNRLLGQPCKKGDRVIIYEVIGTEPQGTVIVTDKTVLHFEK